MKQARLIAAEQIRISHVNQINTIIVAENRWGSGAGRPGLPFSSTVGNRFVSNCVPYLCLSNAGAMTFLGPIGVFLGDERRGADEFASYLGACPPGV